jgi:hypothetical protein
LRRFTTRLTVLRIADAVLLSTERFFWELAVFVAATGDFFTVFLLVWFFTAFFLTTFGLLILFFATTLLAVFLNCFLSDGALVFFATVFFVRTFFAVDFFLVDFLTTAAFLPADLSPFSSSRPQRGGGCLFF